MPPAVLDRVILRSRRARVWLAALAIALLSVCSDPAFGPDSGSQRAVQLAFQPAFQPMDQALFETAARGIDNVHLVLRDANGVIVLDTIIAFPPGQDEVSIAPTVNVRGASERFTVRFELRAGSQTLFEGTQDVEARPGVNTPAPTTIPLVFVGPGARATRVTVSTATETLVAGSSVALSAEVVDATGARIPDALLVWTSSNAAAATVSASGVVTAQSTRGTAVITATTLSGIAGSAPVRVVLPAARVVVTEGDGQAGTVGSPLGQAFSVQVQAADGVGVEGVSVTFAADAVGSAVSPVSATTDADGRASATLTLGRLVGTHTFSATVAGLSAATVSATATRGEATAIAVVSGDAQVDTAGRQLRQPLVVRVTDANGNPASGVGVTWSRVAGAGALSGATSSTDAQGHAQVTYTLGGVPGADVVRATITSVPQSQANFSVTTLPRAASRVVYVSGADQTGAVDEVFAQPLIVRVTDETGQAVPGATVVWNSTNSAVLSARSSTTDATGHANVSVTAPTVPGNFAVSAQLDGVSAASVSFTFTAIAGPAANIAIVAGAGQSAAGGTAVAVAPSVFVTDRFGNALAALSVTFVAADGGSVTGSPATTNVAGIATLGTWTLGPSAGVQTLTISAGSLTATVTATATAVTTPPMLAVSQQPSAAVANTQPFAVQPTVQLKTGAGAPLAISGVTVTVALQTAGPTLRGVLTATTDAAGVAVFSGLSVRGIVGTNVLTFTAPGYSSDTSSTFTLLAGPAVSMAAASATSLTGVVGSVATPNPAVVVSDSSGNAVGGVNVAFAVPSAANGTVSGGAAVTDGTGTASVTSWTLGSTVRSDTLTATVAGVAGSPVTFVATVTAGAATQLVKISGDAQVGVTANPLAAPLVVEARDALNNPVPGVSIDFAVIAGGGTPATQSVVTNAVGQAAFTLTLGAPGADTVRACLPSCATGQVMFTALAIPIGADAIWTGATSSDWSVASNWSPAIAPASTSNVFIPAGQPFGPVLSGNVSVANLTLASGATLNVGTSQLALSGTLLATGATMTGSTGYVYFCGGTHGITGASATVVVDCSATVTPSGTLAIAGNLTVQGGAVFDVAASTVSTTGSFGMYSGARLKMTTAGGTLTIGGTADFNPGNDVGDTWMTNGVLELKGNLTATNSCCSQSFRAVGAHVTRFSGSGPQTVNFYYTDNWGRSTFGNVEFTGSNTVTLTNNMRAFGAVTVSGTATVVGGTIYHVGQLTTGVGTDLSGLSYTQLNGGGAVFPLIGGVSPGEVQIVGSMTVSLPQAVVTLPTNLSTHSGAVLDLEGKTLSVTGNFGMYSQSRVKMVQAASRFTVYGNYTSDPTNDVGDTWMTDGVLELKGNLTATNSCCSQSFRAVGAHVTRFSGSAAQTVNFYYTADWGSSTFGHVEFTGNNTVTLTNNLRAHSTVTVTGTSKVVGSALYHRGQLTTGAGTDLSGLGVTQLNGGGAVFPLIGGIGPGEVQIAGTYTVSLPQAAVTLPTSLTTHSSATLDLEGKALTVTGNFGMYSFSRVRMVQAASRFTVHGNYTSDPGNDVGDTWMIAGILELKGNLTATNSCCSQSFRAVGAHVTRFSGSAPQTVNFAYTNNYGASTFGHVEFTGNNTVTLTNNLRALSTVLVSGTSTVAGGTIYHVGQLTTEPGTDLSGLSATQLNGGGAVFPLIAGLAPSEVQIVGSFTVALPQAAVTLTTNLATYSSAVLDLEGNALTVTGNFGMYSFSRVKMVQAASRFTVNGNYNSDPANDIGDSWMTAGVLELKGNLTTTNSCCAQSFRAVGAHVTRFSGSAPQTVSLYYTTDYGSSTFGHVEFTGNNTVTLTNNMRAHSSVTVTGTSKVVGGTLFHVGQLTSGVSTDLSGLSYTQLNGGGAILPQIGGVGPGEVQLVGGITVSLPQSTMTIPSRLTTHSGAVLDLTDRALTVTGNFGMYSGSRVKMVNAATRLTVGGNADFNPANDLGDSWFTNGILDIKGNFSANNSCCGQSFRAVGSHVTRFSGIGPQSITVYYPGASLTTFAQMEITNASGSGVTTAGGVYVLGALTNLGKFTINVGHAVTVGGALTLGATSSLTNLGTLSKATCSAAVGAVFSGFICP